MLQTLEDVVLLTPCCTLQLAAIAMQTTLRWVGTLTAQVTSCASSETGIHTKTLTRV